MYTDKREEQGLRVSVIVESRINTDPKISQAILLGDEEKLKEALKENKTSWETYQDSIAENKLPLQYFDWIETAYISARFLTECQDPWNTSDFWRIVNSANNQTYLGSTPIRTKIFFNRLCDDIRWSNFRKYEDIGTKHGAFLSYYQFPKFLYPNQYVHPMYRMGNDAVCADIYIQEFLRLYVPVIECMHIISRGYVSTARQLVIGPNTRDQIKKCAKAAGPNYVKWLMYQYAMLHQVLDKVRESIDGFYNDYGYPCDEWDNELYNEEEDLRAKEYGVRAYIISLETIINEIVEDLDREIDVKNVQFSDLVHNINDMNRILNTKNITVDEHNFSNGEIAGWLDDSFSFNFYEPDMGTRVVNKNMQLDKLLDNVYHGVRIPMKLPYEEYFEGLEEEEREKRRVYEAERAERAKEKAASNEETSTTTGEETNNG